MNTKFKIVFPLFLILFLSSYKKPIVVNGWTKNDLKGKVKSLTQIKYSVDTSKSNKKNIIEYFQDNYNEKGQLFEWKKFKYDSSLDFKYFYFYNELGQQIEAKQYWEKSNITTLWESKYDNKGNRIEFTGYKTDGSIINRETYTFNRKGNEIKMELYNYAGILNIYNEKQYNLKGQLTSLKYFGSEGSLIISNSFRYNKNGVLSEKREKYRGILKYIYTYQFDSSANLILSNTYDDKGNLINTLKFEYVYDNLGNWIKQTEFRDKKIYYTTERKIEYF